MFATMQDQEVERLVAAAPDWPTLDELWALSPLTPPPLDTHGPDEAPPGTPASLDMAPPDAVPVDPVPSGWAALDLDATTTDPRTLTDTQLVDTMAGFHRLTAWAQARQSRLVAELDRRRPTTAARYTPDEVALALSMSRFSAHGLLERSRRLVDTLHTTLTAHETGRIDGFKVRVICDAVRHLDDPHAAWVQDQVLDDAPHQSVARLRAALARAVIAADPEGANDRHRKARKDRRVGIGQEQDGMATVWAALAAQDAQTVFGTLTGLARSLGTDDPRGMDARRADLLVGLMTGEISIAYPTPDNPTPDSAPVGATSDSATPDSSTPDSATPGDATASGALDHSTAECGRSDGGVAADVGCLGRDDSRRAGERIARKQGLGGTERHHDGGRGSELGSGEIGSQSTADEEATTITGGDACSSEVRGRATGSDETGSGMAGCGGVSCGGGRDRGAAGSEGTGEAGIGAAEACPVCAAQAWRAARPQLRPVNPAKPLVQVLIAHSTLRGTDHAPAELVGHGAICAEQAREIAADAVWRRLVYDELTGALLDHGRRTYRPPAALADHVRARDVHCRSPLCRRRAIDSELDHTVAFPYGPTAEPNLTTLCLLHHDEKHAPGWTVLQHPDGRIDWTTPTGHTYSSHVHDYRPPPSPPRPSIPGPIADRTEAQPEPSAPPVGRTRVARDWTSAHDRTDDGDDPAPF